MNASKVTFGQMQAAYRAAAEIMKLGKSDLDSKAEVELIEHCCDQENAEFDLQMIDLVSRIIAFTKITNDLRKS